VGRLSQTLAGRAPPGKIDAARLASGFESPFAMRHEGLVYLFSNRQGFGELEIHGISKGAFLFWKLLFFALAFVVAWLGARFAHRIGVGRGAVLVTLALVLLALLVPAGRGTAEVLNGMLYGVLLAAAVVFVQAFVERSRTRRAAPPPSATAETPLAPEAGGEGGAL
jgi:hypothetical protein